MEQPHTAETQPLRDIFPRKVVDVREVFRAALNRHLVAGRIADKEKLEQDKLKISASLVNFVVGGGILLFHDKEFGDQRPAEAEELSTVERPELALDEASLFHLLRKTILVMLGELNKPDVNLLKISLSATFRKSLQEIFSIEGAARPDHFPVKVFDDFHPEGDWCIGINMRNTRSLGDDIDRIERDPALKKEIVGRRRPSRHSDGNLFKMFSSP